MALQRKQCFNPDIERQVEFEQENSLHRKGQVKKLFSVKYYYKKENINIFTKDMNDLSLISDVVEGQELLGISIWPERDVELCRYHFLSGAGLEG